MRLPIILALIVVITLPRDVHGLIEDVSARVQVATVAIGDFFDRDEGTVKVASADVAGVSKGAGR